VSGSLGEAERRMHTARLEETDLSRLLRVRSNEFEVAIVFHGAAEPSES
jgi:hypothetical protein